MHLVLFFECVVSPLMVKADIQCLFVYQTYIQCSFARYTMHVSPFNYESFHRKH